MTTEIYSVISTKDAEAGEGFTIYPVSRTDGKKGKSGICFVAPAVSDSILALVTNDKIGAEWMKAQIAALKSRIASSLHKEGKVISSDSIGITAILEAMKGEESQGRFSKESIGEWFDSIMRVYLVAALEAKGFPAGVIEKTVASFKEQFQLLSGRKVSMGDKQKEQLIKALALIPEDSEDAGNPMTEKIAEKIAAMDEEEDIIAAL